MIILQTEMTEMTHYKSHSREVMQNPTTLMGIQSMNGLHMGRNENTSNRNDRTKSYVDEMKNSLANLTTRVTTTRNRISDLEISSITPPYNSRSQ